MANVLSFYLTDIVSVYRKPFGADGLGSVYGRVVPLLKLYMQQVIDKVPGQFSSVEVWWGPAGWYPQMLDTDIMVYVVPNVRGSVIAANGGSVAGPSADTNILGITDLNLNICEVYWDRTFEGSVKELAGAAYHEGAHLKSRQDNGMHGRQDGFLAAAPDYNGKPTKRNIEFYSSCIGQKVKQLKRAVPK
jgi:hypothetical protein